MGEKKKTEPVQVFVMKMTPALAERLKGQSLGFARMSRAFAVGDRILLREYNGDNTGRADLCEVMGPSADGSTILRRAWSWSQGAPDDLTCLSYVLSSEAFPVRVDVEAAA